VVVVNPHICAGPVIEVGVAGALLTARVLAAELPQALLALTDMLPLTKTALSMATVMTLVVDVPVIPAGSVQV
jgi:hypothetical protein